MQITWYGHSAFRLDFAGKAVLIDPFFTGNPAFVSNKAEAIRGVTHIAKIADLKIAVAIHVHSPMFCQHGITFASREETANLCRSRRKDS